MALTIEELRDEIAQHLQDPTHLLVGRSKLLEFINSAAWDAANEGWVIHIEEDESLTTATDTYDFTVPAGFAYIHEVYVADSNGDFGEDDLVPLTQWRLAFDSAVAVLRFSFEFHTIVDGRVIKLIGQARPTSEYTDDADIIDAGLESFIRERGIMYGARNMARHGGQHAQQYAQLAQETFQSSELMLQQQADRYRPKEFARPVPGT